MSQYELKDVNGNLRLEAQLQNTGTKTVKLGWISAFLFDDQDRILMRVLGKADKEQLAPGEKASFAQDAHMRTTSVKRVLFTPDWDDVDSQTAALAGGKDTSSSPEEALVKLRQRYAQESGRTERRVLQKITLRAPE